MESMGVDQGVAVDAFPMIDKGDMGGLQNLFDTHDLGYSNFDMLSDFISIAGDRSVVEGIRDQYAHNDGVAQSLGRLLEALAFLDMYDGIEYTVDLGIARGLDYYNGVVFELDWDDLGAEKQVCGGGAYELGQLFDLGDVPATGFAIGIDRVALADGMRSSDQGPGDRSGAIVLPMERDGDVMELAVRAVEMLRARGVSAELEIMRRGMGKALKGADQRSLRWAVIVGTDEVAQQKVALKDLDSGEQRHISLEELKDLAS
jgi:histidyl-tRNA synthetase